MKRKVTRISEVQAALRRSRDYDYGTVFETGSGEFAVLWKDYPTVTVILPSELELDARENIMDPFSVARENVHHPAITESNLIFEGAPVFNWCKLALKQDGRIWLQLCDPQNATHMLIYGFRKVSGKPLGADDRGELHLCEYYNEDGARSTLILPVGYIRLSYQTGRADDYALRFVYGTDKDALHERFASRAKNLLTAAQAELGELRSEAEELAERFKRAKQFVANHIDDLNNLQGQRCELEYLAKSCTSEFLTPSEYEKYSRSIYTGINDGACNDAKMHGYGQSFDFSEQGVKEFSELMQKMQQELEDILKQRREEQGKKRYHENQNRAVVERIANAATDRHVRVLDCESNKVYAWHRRGNYRNIRIGFNASKVWIDTRSSFTSPHNLSDEDCCEAIIQELDEMIGQSREYFHKIYFWIHNLLHRSKK